MMDGFGMDGRDWLWMLPMLAFWIIVAGAVVYLIIATRPARDRRTGATREADEAKSRPTS